MAHSHDSCSTCGTQGKSVKIITLKSLLTPQALATLEREEAYRFCPDSGCDVVYFSPSRTYRTTDVKVPVYQKEPGGQIPVCYCFGYTRLDLEGSVGAGHGGDIPQTISEHIKAGRCGCEVNNPQGSCCLGNVNRALSQLAETVKEDSALTSQDR